jgi:hypothetical protein
MAVKQKNKKANDKKSLLTKAVKIKCCYCDKNETCIYRLRKEKSEESGCMTYCTLTPNVPKKQRKNIKR